MTWRTLPWVAVALVEAVLIVLLVRSLTGDPAPPPSKVHAPAPAADDTDGRATAMPAERQPQTANEDPSHTATEPTNAAVPTASADAPAVTGCLLIGNVRMPDGLDMPADVFLTLVPAATSSAVAASRLFDGMQQFAWADVPAGDYELRTRGDALRSTSLPVTVPAGAARHDVDVLLEPSWLVDVLLTTPDGRLLRDALTPELRHRLGMLGRDGPEVIALWHPIPNQMPPREPRARLLTVAQWDSAESTSGEARQRQRAARYAGTLQMPERRDAHVAVMWKDAVVATSPLPAGAPEVALVVDPARIEASLATLRLTVVDSAGAPRTGAKVAANDRDTWHQPVEVDAHGRVQLADLLPGTYSLSIQHGDDAIAPCTVTLAPGQTVDLGRIVASAPRNVTLRFEGPSASGELTASVTSIDRLPHGALQPSTRRLSVQNGVATTALVDGRYLLRASGAGGAVQTFDTRALAADELVVQLRPEAPLELDSTAVDGPTRLTLAAQDGTVVYAIWVTWQSRWEITLLPGSYRATFAPLHGEERTVPLLVPDAGTTLAM